MTKKSTNTPRNKPSGPVGKPTNNPGGKVIIKGSVPRMSSPPPPPPKKK